AEGPQGRRPPGAFVQDGDPRLSHRLVRRWPTARLRDQPRGPTRHLDLVGLGANRGAFARRAFQRVLAAHLARWSLVHICLGRVRPRRGLRPELPKARQQGLGLRRWRRTTHLAWRREGTLLLITGWKTHGRTRPSRR